MSEEAALQFSIRESQAALHAADHRSSECHRLTALHCQTVIELVASAWDLGFNFIQKAV